MAALLLAVSTNLSAQAADEYEKLIDEMRQRRSTVSPGEFIGIMEERLVAFISRFPDSPEAADAHLSLGQLYVQTGRPEKAVIHLEAFIARGDEGRPGEIAGAKYYLGKSYLMLDELDKAEAPLREIAGAGRGIPERIRSAAAMDLERIPVLRRLVIGNPAIPIEAKTSDGKEISLENYKGTVLLLDFWASWCAPCRHEMPNVKKIYKEFNSKGFEILGISLDESSAKFRGFIEEQGITWPQIFDGKGWNSEVGKSYAVSSIPATFLLDRKGRIRYRDLRGTDLRAAVENLIEER